MYKTEVWNKFIGSLIEANFKEHQKTKEYEYLKNREEHIDEMLTTNLTTDEKVMVDEVLSELGMARDHESKKLYEQGIKDCVMILKELGVV